MLVLYSVDSGGLFACDLSDDFKNFHSLWLQVCPVHSFTEPSHIIILVVLTAPMNFFA